MALIFQDGFDLYENALQGTPTTTQLRRRWTSATDGAWNLYTSAGRFGGGCIEGAAVTGNQQLYKDFPLCGDTVGNKFVASFAFRGAPNPGARTLWFSLGDGANTGTTAHLTFVLNPTGTLDVTRAGTILFTTPTPVNQNGVWRRLEVEAYIDDTAGTVRVWLDGALIVDFTGDTRNAGTKGVARLAFAYQGWAFRLDDVLLFNTSGAAPNAAPLGDFQIDLLRPNAAGSAMQGTVVGAATALDAVKETIADSDTTYVAVAPGQQVLLNAPDIQAASVIGVAVIADVRVDGPAARNVGLKAKLGASTAAGAVSAPGQGTYATREAYLSKPGGGAWTGADFNAAEFGFEVST